MRLIDADKLERQIVGYGSGRQEWVIKADKVDNASTVEAIPISFIKEIIRAWNSLSPRYCELTTRDFEWLIEKWEYDRDLEQLKSELKKIEEDAFK